MDAMNDERMSADRIDRTGKLTIAWAAADEGIGAVSLDGVVFARVEWSEKRQAWCVEDAAGQCLRHVGSIKGAAASKEEAVALAEAMIADGRMPDPETAWKEYRERQRIAREKRDKQPAQIRKAEEQRAFDQRRSDASTEKWEAQSADKDAGPLYEALADAFDFADPELWKSNSFAALRPRLVLHVRAVVAELEYDLVYETSRSRSQPFCGLGATKERRQRAAAYRKAETSAAIGKIEAKLARAREILGRLVSSDSGGAST